MSKDINSIIRIDELGRQFVDYWEKKGIEGYSWGKFDELDKALICEYLSRSIAEQWNRDKFWDFEDTLKAVREMVYVDKCSVYLMVLRHCEDLDDLENLFNYRNAGCCLSTLAYNWLNLERIVEMLNMHVCYVYAAKKQIAFDGELLRRQLEGMENGKNE